jgi:hypothetical protein
MYRKLSKSQPRRKKAHISTNRTTRENATNLSKHHNTTKSTRTMRMIGRMSRTKAFSNRNRRKKQLSQRRSIKRIRRLERTRMTGRILKRRSLRSEWRRTIAENTKSLLLIRAAPMKKETTMILKS